MIWKYAVAKAKTTEELEEIVNNHIDNDWQPLGGINVTIFYPETLRETFYMQAMVRETKE